MNPLNPKKLLLTKWTAVNPLDKQKHFLVSRVIQPEITCPRWGRTAARHRFCSRQSRPALRPR